MSAAGYSTTQGERMYPVSPLTTMFNDIPAEGAEVFIKDYMSLQPASGWDDDQISYCGRRDIPSVCLCCEGDALLPPSVQRQIAEVVGAEVESCTASHMVVSSQPGTSRDCPMRHKPERELRIWHSWFAKVSCY